MPQPLFSSKLVSVKRLRIAALALTVLALVGGAQTPPTSAQAFPLHLAAADPSVCTISGGELSWGVKESFRAYISGSIAGGGWEVSDGANYETPLFSWSAPSGTVSATGGDGAASFTGAIRFTGHAGVLDLTLANPNIEFLGDGTARLRMDVRSNDAEGQLTVDARQLYFAKLKDIGQLDPASGVVELSEIPAVLTAEGADAFGSFYGSGEVLDPLQLSLHFEPCEGSPQPVATAPGDPEAAEQAAGAAHTQQELPLLPIIIGAVALVVVLVSGGVLLAGRAKGRGAADE